VSGSGLTEGTPVGEERRDAGLSPRGVVAVDEVAEWVERDVLGEGHGERQPSRLRRDAPSNDVVGQAKERAVHHVESESDRAPASSTGDCLAEHGHIGVVAAEEPLVDRLEGAPERRGKRSGRRRVESTLRHNRKRARR
jgi:hypothetical protein